MTNKKSTKRALLTSILSLLLCCSMLIGTTFAWFTDEVKSANNIITAGNLDVELKYAKVANGQIVGWNTVQGATDIFDPDALWEPGRVEVVYLEVSNLGNLVLKYQLGVNVASETPGISMETNAEFKLSDYLVFKVVEMPDALTTYTDREAVQAVAGTSMGLADYNGTTTALEVGGVDYVALIVYMPETVDNKANYKTGTTPPSITLGINLFATQQMAENDSFGPDYDEDAWVGGLKVYNAQDLQAALNNGETNIVLMDDIETDESIIIPAAPTTYSMRTNAITINLNGKTITGTVGRDAEGNRVHVVVNNGNAIIANGTVKSADFDGGSAIYNGEGAALTLEKVTALGAPQKNNVYPVSAYPSYAINNYGDLVVNGATVKSYHGAIGTGGNGVTVINDADIDVGLGQSTGITSYAIYAFENGEVTINGGNFAFTKQEVYVNGGNMFCELGSKPIVINGGTFAGGGFSKGDGREYVIKGGTFDADPSAYVADGYKAVQSNGKYVVVPDTIADTNVVGTPAELESALAGAADAGSGDNTLYLTGDIDLSGSTWTPIEVDGYNGAGIITIEGNGATIKGLTAPLFAGGFAGKSGIVIKNLTIADSNIVSTSGLGGGAFIDTADSMQIITLDNCHLVNSTVTGERTGGLIGWCSGYAKLNDGPVKTYVTITNCSVVDSTVIGNGSAGGIAGHPGASDYTYTTIENCVVKNVDVVSYEPVSSWRTGAIVGTANNGHVVINNVTVEDVTLTQDGVTATETKLFGRFVPAGTGTLIIDGVEQKSASTQDALNSAVSEPGAEVNVTLAEGNYTMPTTNGDVTISGTKDTIISGNDATAKNVTFNGVTIQSTGAAYTGIKHSDTVVYNDVTIVGNMYLYAENVVFNNCTFDLSSTNDYIWVYGATNVEFNNCTFNTMGKAILVFQDGSSVAQTVKVEGCTFNASAPAYNWNHTIHIAAVSIDGNQGGTYNIILNNNTVDADFNGLWQDKTAAGNITVTVDGATVLNP